jgi:hypothetical protein
MHVALLGCKQQLKKNPSSYWLLDVLAAAGCCKLAAPQHCWQAATRRKTQILSYQYFLQYFVIANYLIQGTGDNDGRRGTITGR